MGTEAGGTEVIREKTEQGERGFPNTVWECCMKRLLPSRWPCLNGGSSVQRGRISASQGLQPGLLSVAGLLSNVTSCSYHFTHKFISVPC